MNGHAALDLSTHVTGEQITLQEVNTGVEERRVEALGKHFERRRGLAAGVMIGRQARIIWKSARQLNLEQTMLTPNGRLRERRYARA